jgi:hypothetical protein
VRRLLTWLGVASGTFTVVLGATVLFARFVAGPIGPFPGGQLRGEPAAAAGEDDWGPLLADGATIALEVRPDDPYSVTTSHILREGLLYVPCMSCARKTWPGLVAHDDRVVLRINGELYPRRAIRVIDAGEVRSLVREIDGARDEQGKVDLTLLTTWYFRIEPR